VPEGVVLSGEKPRRGFKTDLAQCRATTLGGTDGLCGPVASEERTDQQLPCVLAQRLFGDDRFEHRYRPHYLALVQEKGRKPNSTVGAELVEATGLDKQRRMGRKLAEGVAAPHPERVLNQGSRVGDLEKVLKLERVKVIDVQPVAPGVPFDSGTAECLPKPGHIAHK
jgi:hypothetical protein